MNDLRTELCEANCEIIRRRLAVLTWGNVSCRVDSSSILIKPSGVPYETMSAQDMVLVDMQGRVLEGGLRPSCDTPTHLEIYRVFPQVRAICHVHSSYATAFAQAGKLITPMGTTQADSFAGAIPVTRQLTPQEVEQDYELNTGRVIAEALAGLDVTKVPGVLVCQHGVFTWGNSPRAAVDNAYVLEQVAKINFRTLLINPSAPLLPDYLLRKHEERKHGSSAYYGQPSDCRASSLSLQHGCSPASPSSAPGASPGHDLPPQYPG